MHHQTMIALALVGMLTTFMPGQSARAEEPSLLAVAARRTDAGRQTGPAPTVSLSSQGGYRWSHIERITIAEVDGAAKITVERVPYEGKAQGPTTFDLAKADYDKLVATLESNDALHLKDDMTKKGRATDLPDYDISIALKAGVNHFRVYGPQLLHNGSTNIVDAIEGVAEKALPSPRM